MTWAIIYGGILALVCLCCWAPRDLRRKPPQIFDLTEFKAKRR